MNTKPRVLVIDDEPQILRALRINLSVRGYDVSVAATGLAGEVVLHAGQPGPRGVFAVVDDVGRGQRIHQE